MYMMYSCVWCSLFLSRREWVYMWRGGEGERGEGERGEGERGRRVGRGGDERKGASRRGKGSGVGEGAATQVFADVTSS